METYHIFEAVTNNLELFKKNYNLPNTTQGSSTLGNIKKSWQHIFVRCILALLWLQPERISPSCWNQRSTYPTNEYSPMNKNIRTHLAP